ncbi:hypothetical protein ACLOJK_028320 [Asimina triloba]
MQPSITAAITHPAIDFPQAICLKTRQRQALDRVIQAVHHVHDLELVRELSRSSILVAPRGEPTSPTPLPVPPAPITFSASVNGSGLATLPFTLAITAARHQHHGKSASAWHVASSATSTTDRACIDMSSLLQY